jgi:hypothetical protein
MTVAGIAFRIGATARDIATAGALMFTLGAVVFVNGAATQRRRIGRERPGPSGRAW